MYYLYISILILPTLSSECNIQNCLQCSSSSPNICLGCEPSFTLSKSGCTYSDSLIAAEISNCKIQGQDQLCEVCLENYHLYYGFCQANCLYGCVCFEPYKCETEMGPSEAEIDLVCPNGCSKCDRRECYKCYYGYKLYNGQCIYCPDSKCKKCYQNDICVECESGYYEYQGRCYECESHCKECKGSMFCSSCKSGYKLKNGFCNEEDSDSDSDTHKLATAIVIIIVVFSSIALISLIICICIYRKRRLNGNLAQQVVVPQSYIYQGQPLPQPAETYSYYPSLSDHQPQPMYYPPSVVNQVNPSVRVAQLDSRNQVLGQENCLFCGQNFSRDTETWLLPCNHAFHRQCVQNSVGQRGNRSCSVCNTQFF